MSDVRGEQMDLRFDSSGMSSEPVTDAELGIARDSAMRACAEILKFPERKNLAPLQPDLGPLLQRILHRVSRF